MKPHTALVKRAAAWLVGTRRCVLVLQEANCWAVNEFPDAIGWLVDGRSIMVECKTSRADFHRDKHKASRRLRDVGMGRERWYLAPRGVLTAEDMPPGYGLLEMHGTRRLRVIAEADTAERPGRQDAEIKLLIATSRKEAWAHEWDGRQVVLRAVPCDETEPTDGKA